jgi:amidase
MNASLVEQGRSVTAVELIDATGSLARWSHEVASAYADFDVLLTPTLPITPPRLGVINPAEVTADGMTVLQSMTEYLTPFDVSGQPAISLPTHMSAAGLPIGVHLVAAYGREDLLFRVAAQLEQAIPWAGRAPTF